MPYKRDDYIEEKLDFGYMKQRAESLSSIESPKVTISQWSTSPTKATEQTPRIEKKLSR